MPADGLRRDADNVDALCAAQLDADADLIVSAHPAAEDVVREAMLRGGGRARRAASLRSVGLRREAIRLAARELGIVGAAEPLAAADAHRWCMVRRHEALQQREANRVAGRDADFGREVLAVMRLGWFRAAMRWEPDGNASFHGFALAWGRAAWGRSNERQRTVALNRGWGRTECSSLDAHQYDDSDLRWVDTLAAEPVDFDAPLLEERLRIALHRLDPRDRDIVVRLADGEPARAVGESHGLGKSRTTQLGHLAVDALRSRLMGATTTPRTP